MSKNKERLLLLLIFIFSLMLRLALLTQKNLWFDEIFSWHLVQGSILNITWGTSADIHPPFYYYLLKVWTLMFGDSVFSLRFLSALLSSSAIIFIYPVARKVMNEVESLIVILLYSLSPLNLYYSQEARMAALNLFLNAAALYFFIKTLEFKGSFFAFVKSSEAWAYLLLTILALYTHYFSFTFLMAGVLFILFNVKNLSRRIYHFVFIYILIFAGYLFWLPIMIKQMNAGQSWRTGQSIFSLIQQLFYFSKDISLGLYHFYGDYELMKIINVMLASLFCLTIIGLLHAAYKSRIRHRKIKKSFPNNKELLVFVTAIPLMIASIIYLREKIEFFRYLSFIVPYILICGMIGIRKLHVHIKTAVIVMFAAINCYGDYLYYSFDFKNNDYRKVITALEKNSKSDEKLFIYPHYYGWILDYYKKQDDLKIPNISEMKYGWSELQDSISIQNPKIFWLVLDYGSQDTLSYKDKLNTLMQNHNITYNDSFPTVPFEAKIYRFERND